MNLQIFFLSALLRQVLRGATEAPRKLPVGRTDRQAGKVCRGCFAPKRCPLRHLLTPDDKYCSKITGLDFLILTPEESSYLGGPN